MQLTSWETSKPGASSQKTQHLVQQGQDAATEMPHTARTDHPDQ